MPKPTDKDVKPDFAATARPDFLAAATEAGRKGPPPVHLWNPEYCGEMDLTIRADGSWWHEGTPMGRPAMVRLFASILKREGDRYFLVTPVEKLGITVEDAPFIAIDAVIGKTITFETNVGDHATLSPENPLRIDGSADAPRPYVHIRRDLWALIDRKTFYRLAETAKPGPDGRLGVTSGGHFFALEV